MHPIATPMLIKIARKPDWALKTAKERFAEMPDLGGGMYRHLAALLMTQASPDQVGDKYGLQLREWREFADLPGIPPNVQADAANQAVEILRQFSSASDASALARQIGLG